MPKGSRIYGPAQAPYARVWPAAEVSTEQKARLQHLHHSLNPFQLLREIERQKKQINQCRLLQACAQLGDCGKNPLERKQEEGG